MRCGAPPSAVLPPAEIPTFRSVFKIGKRPLAVGGVGGADVAKGDDCLARRRPPEDQLLLTG